MPLAGESLEMKQGASGMRKRIFGRIRAVGTVPRGIRRAVSRFGCTNSTDPQLAFTVTLDKEIRDFLKHEVTAHVATSLHSTLPRTGLSAR